MSPNNSVHNKLRLLVLLPVFATACSLFNVLAAIRTPFTSPSTLPAPIQPIPPPFVIPSDIVSEQSILSNLYVRTNPSVVNITTFALQGKFVIPMSQGSGFVYDSSGNIVTNAHVVDRADQVEVTFSNGIIKPAEIIGQDPHSDLAVLKVDDLPEGVSPLPLGDIDDLAVGQTVVAIGNPFGLEGTLTSGIISALGRTIPALTPFSIPQAIQTDAAINPGNSGGPLLDLEGNVVGVNAQIETGGSTRTNSGVGFAIPISVVKRVVPVLIEQGLYEWAWLGVRGGNVTPMLVEAMELSVERGAYIVEVTPKSPAEDAKLRGATEIIQVDGRQIEVGGDIVTAFDNQPVRDFSNLLIYISLHAEPKQTVALTILRDSEFMTVDVRLGTRPEELSADQ